MSNISQSPTPQPTQEPTQTPAPKQPVPNGGLPDSVKVNGGHDASEFFNKHVAANPGLADKLGIAPVASPSAPAAPQKDDASAPADNAPAPKGSVAAKLAGKNRHPQVPKQSEPATAAPQPDGGAPKDPLSEHNLPPGYSKNAKEAFDNLKTLARGLQDQLASARETERQLKSQLEAARSSTPTPDVAEMEKLRAEHKALSDRLALVDLREHPKFQAEVLQPQQAAIAEAQAIFEANGKTVDLASMLAKSKPEFLKAVGEATKELSVAEQVEVSNNMRSAYQLKQQGDSMLGKSRETYGALRNQSLDRQKQVFEQTWAKVAAPITEHLVEIEEPDNATPEQKQDIADFNASVRGLRGAAERIAFGESKTEDIATNSIKAAAYDLHVGKVLPKILSEYESLLTLNKQLSDQLAAVRARNPNRSGTAPAIAAGGPGDPQDPRNMDHKAAADYYFKR